MTVPPPQPHPRLKVCAATDLPAGAQTIVDYEGQSVLVLNDGGQFYALRNQCSHQVYPLLGGEVSMGRITCDKHGAKFELATGKAKTLPAVKPVAIYRTLLEDGTLYIEAL